MGPHTAAALGAAGGFIADELKGDLARAGAAATAALAQAEALGDAAAVADGRLAVGLVAVLRGDCGQAKTRLAAAQAGLSGADAQLARVLLALAQQTGDIELPTGARATSVIAPPPQLHAASAEVMLNARVPLARNPADEPPPVSGEVLELAPPEPLPFELELRARALPDEDFSDPTAALIAAVLLGLPDLRARGVAAQSTPLDVLLPADLAVSVPDAWRAYALRSGAEILHRAGRSAEAFERLDEAIALYEQLGDAVGAGACHLLRGDLELTPFSPLGLGFALVESQFGAGGELPTLHEERERGRLDAPAAQAAAAAYERARGCFTRPGVVAPRAHAALALREGFAALLAGRPPTDAVGLALKAHDGFKAAGDSRGARLANAHAAVAAIECMDLGLLDALESYRTAMKIGAWGAGDGSFAFALGIGHMFARAGRGWHARLDPERAERGYRLALEVYSTLDAHQNAIQTHIGLGRLYAQLGHWANALVEYDAAELRSLATARKRPDADLPEALRARRFIRRQRAAGEYVSVIAARGSADKLAELERELRKMVRDAKGILLPPGAKPSELQRLARQMETTLLPMIEVLVHVLRGLATLDDVVRARFRGEAVAAAEGLDRPDLKATALAALGSRTDAATAYALFVDSAPVQDRDEQARRIAMLVRLGDFNLAETMLAVLTGDGGSLKEIPWLAPDDLGQLHEHRGDLRVALDVYKAEIKRIEDRRARLTLDELRVAQTQGHSTVRTFLHAARAAFTLAAAPGVDDRARTTLHEEAFGYAERGRSRALLDLMDDEPEVEIGQEARRWREACAQLELAQQQLAGAIETKPRPKTRPLRRAVTKAERARLEAELALEHKRPGWREIVGVPAPLLTIDQVRLRLGADTLLLQYHFFERDFLAWAIRREEGLTDVVFKQFNEADELPKRIRRLDHALRDSSNSWRDRGKAVAEEMLEPFDELLKDPRYNRLVIVPFGSAHRVPFAVLPLENELLVTSHILSVLPSASALGFIDVNTDLRDGPMLAVGDPAPLADGLKPVPWAGAAAGFAMHRRPGSKVLLGRDATKQRLHAALERPAGRGRASPRERDFQIVLFATHASTGEHPPRALLALAERQVLELYELLGMDFRDIPLVVLAACKTGIGAITSGDEVIAMTRGLLAAGAQRIVVTLRDAFVSSLPLFIRALSLKLEAGLDPAAALAATQRDFIALTEEQATAAYEELKTVAAAPPVEFTIDAPAPTAPGEGYGHPRHWAPYVLVGT